MLSHLLNPVEHVVDQGIFSYHEQCRFVPKCFQRSSAVDPSNYDCMWPKVNDVGMSFWNSVLMLIASEPLIQCPDN